VAAAVAAAAPPPPPVAGGAAAAAAAGATPALVRARCAVCGAAVLGGRVSVGGADSGVMAFALVAWRPLAASLTAFTHALCRGPVSEVRCCDVRACSRLCVRDCHRWVCCTRACAFHVALHQLGVCGRWL
jgi:hypothetical protein